MRFSISKSCLVVALALLPLPAMAGFEFTPPPPKPTISVAPEISVESEPMPMPSYSEMDVAPMPVAPVVATPLPTVAPMMRLPPPPMPGEMSARVSVNPMSPQAMVPMMPPTMPPQNIVSEKPAVVAPAQTEKSGLIIDPYPLQNKEVAVVSYQRMEQAMAERSGGLHPVQLGGGMTTGANAKKERLMAARAKMPTKSIEPIAASALTPMMGNEPAPLPGYGVGKVEREEIRQYAQAVGFGKDLPLALAISQVIPSEYTHRFDGDADAALKVDWEGGKPWNLVLNDMLREHNMRAEIEGNVVVIKETAKI